MTDQELTKEEARERLTSAIQDYIKVVKAIRDDELLSTWVIVAHVTAIEEQNDSDAYVLIGSQRHLPSHIKMGLLQAGANAIRGSRRRSE